MLMLHLAWFYMAISRAAMNTYTRTKRKKQEYSKIDVFKKNNKKHARSKRSLPEQCKSPEPH